MTAPKDPLDEALQALQNETAVAMRPENQDGTFSKPVLAIARAKIKAKQQILTHYISFDELEKMLDEFPRLNSSLMLQIIDVGRLGEALNKRRGQ